MPWRMVAFSLACIVLGFVHLREVEQRNRALFGEVGRALERALGLVELLLLHLHDAEREPVVGVTAARDDLSEHLLGLLEALVLHQLLRVHARALRVGAVLLVHLLETIEQVLDADEHGPTFLILHLHRRAVEAEQLPHLLLRERHRPVDERLGQRLAIGADGNHHHRARRKRTALKRARRRENGSARRLETFG